MRPWRGGRWGARGVSGGGPSANSIRTRVARHGPVALEIDGHIHPVAGNPAALHRAEMLDLVRSLGLS
ncbi:hypothetical protein OG413_07615 [Streptomyces sp. NBC_01433]|uniref:hypothetical protein n=1 Tax=Streptomyces sp. NBC_01433 TaxID=2903864 RepID=UPI002253A021|nr:hypothetical protein [Streptomyces sp. NBC_01433]MCX4675189.1 hypothetical protein [Streptomyces sp. NBC_01433]